MYHISKRGDAPTAAAPAVGDDSTPTPASCKGYPTPTRVTIDGRPVTWIWLLTSPPDKTGPHIHALARISRLMTIDKFRQALAGAKTPEEVFDIVQQQENAL